MVDILPDSRVCRSSVSISRGRLGSWVPIYCANCGADGGQVPEENMTFIFYLCNNCATTHGHIAGTMMMPDEVFFQRLAEEQLERYGRYLEDCEWERVSEASSHPLLTLIQDYRH